ncbi:MAG: Fmu (Sun) domain protein [Bacteroidetes bacterium]|nr:Fmu (Sun) domain protein [Bacteroidota bacterium]
MQLPGRLIASLERISGFGREAFERLHSSGGQVTSVRINPARQSEIPNLQSEIPWTEYGYYLSERPSFTFDPLFHAGCYYVQEASSMFLEQALKQTADLSKPLKVLDLCAAPGGKSTHIQSLISGESLLVSNEVIRSRAAILKDNIIKWGCENVVVTNNDPADFAELENYFDIIVADAPCSGSGLFRRDPESIKEWTENNVQLCSQRQQRILADVWPALKKGGILIYSTCSYSQEEDEDIVNWLQEEFAIDYLPLAIDPAWGITDTGKGYRFWPDKVKGEGFFLACLQKKDGEETAFFKTKKKIEQASEKEMDILKNWMKPAGKSFIRYRQTVYAWPDIHFNDFSYLLEKLKVIYSGVQVGELMRDKLVPGHALAMSAVAAESIPKTELGYHQAISYLQRRELRISNAERGWQQVSYRGHPLGWINVLPGRINNYYPKELRILKDK